ncbi:MAG TPA: sigma-70 family RNA polymerase sigma factor [Acidimicrobiales bacterium]|nr:sigma-70 family RNA polymerase sigma factor [Acidimicrobiales bacterium]
MAVQFEDLDLAAGASPAERWDRGEEAAFQEAYERYHDRIFRFCRYRLGDAHEAEDVTQEAFARAWKNPTVLLDPGRVYPWLRVVAANLCTDHHRRRGRCQPKPEIDSGTEDRTEAEVIGAHQAELVRTAMARLTDRHRIALEQREDAGWTYEQMAAHSGTTIASVESLLWRARQALKREFVAIAGQDGYLAGLPVIGFFVRRFHQVKAKARAWLANSGAIPQLSAGNAMLSTFVGSAAAACVAGMMSLVGPTTAPPATHLTGVPSGATGAATSTGSSVPARPAAQGGPSSAPASPGWFRSRGYSQPVSVGYNQQDARSMPVSVGVGSGANGDAIGVDPTAPVSWARAVVKNRVLNALNTTTFGGHK